MLNYFNIHGMLNNISNQKRLKQDILNKWRFCI